MAVVAAPERVRAVPVADIPTAPEKLAIAAVRVPVSVGLTENTEDPHVPVLTTRDINSAQVSISAALKTAEPASVSAPEIATVPSTLLSMVSPF